MITKERTAFDRQRVQKRVRYRVVYVAGLLTLLIFFAVQAGTRYAMNDWTRERVERVMSNNLGRKVTLGKTSWSLGFQGLVLNTDGLNVRNRDGTAFILSHDTEIGVPLLPMLNGEMLVRHLRFEDPQVYAVRLPGNKWNFADLPEVKALKKVALLEMNGGTVHIVDRAGPVPARWSPRRLEHIGFRLERPFENQGWPFALSFAMPQKNYTTRVDVSGIGNGAVDDWSKNNHTFELSAQSINVEDFRDFWPNLPSIEGLLNVNLRGTGIPEKEFRASAAINAPKLRVDAPGFGAMNLDNGYTSGNFVLSANKIEWEELKVVVPHFEMSSRGKLLKWQDVPSYSFDVWAKSDELGQVAKIIPANVLPREILRTSIATRLARERKPIMTVEQALYPARLTGKGEVRAHITGSGKQPVIAADMKATDVKTLPLAELRPFKEFPILGVVSANPNSAINVQMILHPSGRTDIPSGVLKIQDSSFVTFQGFIDPSKDRSHLAFMARRLNLAHLSNNLQTSQSRAQLNRMLGMPAASRFRLTGTLDLRGVVDTVGGKQHMNATSDIRNASLVINRGHLSAHNINGRIISNTNGMILNNITGTIGGGRFKLNGAMPMTPSGPLDLHLVSTSIDMATIKAAVQAFGHKAPPLLSNNSLRGEVRDLSIRIFGFGSRPQVVASGRPHELYFVPPGSPGAVRLTSGRFSLANNQIHFDRLGGWLGKGTFQLAGQAGTGSSDLIMQGRNIDIREFKAALIALDVKAPILSDQTVFGRVRAAVLIIKTRGKSTDFSLTASPLDVYYIPDKLPRTFILTGGVFQLNGNNVVLNQVKGTLGKGTFMISGTWKLGPQPLADVVLNASNIDLSNVKAALRALKVNSPLLAQQKLYGKVKSTRIVIKGPAKTPTIAMVAYPLDIYFEPYGSTRTVHFRDGMISYNNDVLQMKALNVVSARSKIKLASLVISNLSKGSRLEDLQLSSPGFELGDLHSFLAAPRTPPMVRQKYLDLLSSYGLSNPVGKFWGTVSYHRLPGAIDNSLPLESLPRPAFGQASREVLSPPDTIAVRPQFDFKADVHFVDVGVSASGFPFSKLSGHLLSAGEELRLLDVKGLMGQSPFSMVANIDHFRSPHRQWSADVEGQVLVSDFLSLLPSSQAQFKDVVYSSEPIPVRFAIVGNPTKTAAVFSSTVAADTEFRFNAPMGVISKPANQDLRAEGSFTFEQGPPAILEFQDSKLVIGETALAWSGNYVWQSGNVNEEPVIDFTIALNNPVSAKTLLSFFPVPAIEPFINEMTGRIGGMVRLNGPLMSPATMGEVKLFDIAIPRYNVTGITGSIEAADWFSPKNPAQTAELTGSRSRAKLHLNTLNVGPVPFQDICGHIVTEDAIDGTLVSLEQVAARIFTGTATLDGWVKLNQDRDFKLNVVFEDIDTNRFATTVLKAPNEISGRLDGSTRLTGKAANSAELASSIVGDGHVLITDGEVKRFGLLQTRLTQLNFLKSGILGFNLNNLLASLAPIKSGKFKTITGNFQLDKGLLTLTRVAYYGDDLRMRAQGIVNLISKQVQVQAAGTIPRVSNAVLKGPLGVLGKLLSPRVIFDIIANKAFEKFPDIPLLGSPGGSGQRAFEFTVAGDLRDPDSFAQSIYKTFRWLPEQPKATPYPVLGTRERNPEEVIE